MDILTNGTYFGQNDFTYQKGGIHLTETVYTHPRVDWHFHENAYITLLLNGGMREGNKKEEYQCVPGTILYHHWQDAHYNIKEPRFTKGFHIEISSGLFNKWDYDRGKKEGSYRLMHPEAKLLIYKLLYELKGDDEISDLAIESLVTHLFLSFMIIRQPSKKSNRLGSGRLKCCYMTLLRDPLPWKDWLVL
ncbi:MAG: hypothetical protein IPK46_16825 [Saprospiraceae bacterium]|nr:hypothetical protein [Saprospiraceae bacterium]